MEEESPSRRLTVGILAHVDAGKTTLSEGLLYLAGRIRKLGRVDHGDTYLDTNPMERERGITIFSKQARLTWEDLELVLLDTPGHVDFSAETERALGVLDYAILVISGTDGVQNHTLTLWQLLRTYHVPTFLFINKMDLPTDGEAALEQSLREHLDPGCFACFSEESADARLERLAMTSEELLEPFLADGTIGDEAIARQIAARRLFPCFFGSALRLAGVKSFLRAFRDWTLSPAYPDAFGAKVYKIARDGNTRLTYLKVTGGVLRVRDELRYVGESGKPVAEKVSQLRLYSGDKFVTAECVRAGDVCAVPGLSATYAGLGLGMEPDSERPVLEPVLTYRLRLPDGCDVNLFYPKFKQLEEEDPALHLVWEERLHEIHARLMGEVQIDILRRTVRERFGIDVAVDEGKILYKETPAHAAEGVGHFEPLRHYAEVHLLLEPLPAGSGVVFDTRCPENVLDRNWQRLILTHLGEKTHRGILIGAPLTDVKITLLTGRAHLKHTEGGDFREATYRAVRQGLMQVPSVLLEPYYRYTLEIPADCTGRAMADLQTRNATFALEDADGRFARIRGRVPVAKMRNYTRDVAAYTHGEGRLFCTFDGYAPCHDSEDVIAAAQYHPESDLENTPDSVFCAHGAGFSVPWDQVRDLMHVDSGYTALGKRQKTSATADAAASDLPLRSVRTIARDYRLEDDELEAIMLREFGPMKRRQYSERHVVNAAASRRSAPPVKPPRLIIDGYNLIFQWDVLREIADESLEKAREVLMDILSNYVAFTKTDVTLVFDAYQVKEATARTFTRDGYEVIFTAQNETGDACIERMIHELGADYRLRVVTSDRLIQFSAVTVGVLRMSAREFIEEVTRVDLEIIEFIRKLAEEKE